MHPLVFAISVCHLYAYWCVPNAEQGLVECRPWLVHPWRTLGVDIELPDAKEDQSIRHVAHVSQVRFGSVCRCFWKRSRSGSGVVNSMTIPRGLPFFTVPHTFRSRCYQSCSFPCVLVAIDLHGTQDTMSRGFWSTGLCGCLELVACTQVCLDSF